MSRASKQRTVAERSSASESPMQTRKRAHLDAACRLASTHMHTHPRNLREYKVMGAGIRAGASHLTDERSLALAVFRLDHDLSLSQLVKGGEAWSV